MRTIFIIILSALLLGQFSCWNGENDSIEIISEDFIKNNIDYKTIIDVTDTLNIATDYYLLSYYLKSADIYIEDLNTGNIQIQISRTARELLNKSMAGGQFETVVVRKKKHVIYTYRTSSKPINWPKVKFAYYYNPSDYKEQFKDAKFLNKFEKPGNDPWLYKISENYIFFSY